jgi:hypothetical protein
MFNTLTVLREILAFLPTKSASVTNVVVRATNSFVEVFG